LKTKTRGRKGVWEEKKTGGEHKNYEKKGKCGRKRGLPGC